MAHHVGLLRLGAGGVAVVGVVVVVGVMLMVVVVLGAGSSLVGSTPNCPAPSSSSVAAGTVDASLDA